MGLDRPAVGVAKGVSYQIVKNLAVTAVSVAGFAIIARLVSRQEMGELAVLMLITAGTTALAGLGVGSAATRFVASFDASDKSMLRKVGYDSLLVNTVATVILVSGLFITADSIAGILLGSTAKGYIVKLLCLEAAAVGPTDALFGILTGLKRFKELSTVVAVTFIIRQTLVVSFLTFGLGVPGIVVGWGFGDALTTVWLAVYVRRFLGPPSFGFGIMKLLRFSAPLLLTDAANYLWTWFDRGLLLPLVTLAQLGSYNVAVTAFGLLNSMSMAISGTLLPFYSDLYTDKAHARKVDLEIAVRTASRYVSFLIVPTSVGLAATALPSVTLLAGNGYADAAVPLAVLSISLAIGCHIRALSQLYLVLGKTAWYGFTYIISVLLPILFGVIAVPAIGILGASLARALSIILLLALSIPILRRAMKLEFDLKAYEFTWIASAIMAGSVLLIEHLFYNKLFLPLYGLFGAAVLIFSFRSLHVVNSEDIELLSGFLSHRFRFLATWLARILAVPS